MGPQLSATTQALQASRSGRSDPRRVGRRTAAGRESGRCWSAPAPLRGRRLQLQPVNEVSPSSSRPSSHFRGPPQVRGRDELVQLPGAAAPRAPSVRAHEHHPFPVVVASPRAPTLLGPSTRARCSSTFRGRPRPFLFGDDLGGQPSSGADLDHSRRPTPSSAEARALAPCKVHHGPSSPNARWAPGPLAPEEDAAFFRSWPPLPNFLRLPPGAWSLRPFYISFQHHVDVPRFVSACGRNRLLRRRLVMKRRGAAGLVFSFSSFVSWFFPSSPPCRWAPPVGLH